MKTKLIPLIVAMALQAAFQVTLAPPVFADVSMDSGDGDGDGNSGPPPDSSTDSCDPTAEASRC